MNERIKAGRIQKGLDDGEDILEYNGKGVRNEANCDGFCVGKSWPTSHPEC